MSENREVEKLKVTAGQLNDISLKFPISRNAEKCVYAGSYYVDRQYIGQWINIKLSNFLINVNLKIQVVNNGDRLFESFTVSNRQIIDEHDNSELIITKSPGSAVCDVFITGSYGTDIDEKGTIVISKYGQAFFKENIGEVLSVADLPILTNVIFRKKIKNLKDTDNSIVSSTNTYNPKNINFVNNATGEPTVNLLNINCPNGFELVGYSDSHSSMRISNVFTSNGRYIISFDIKGLQSINSLAFNLEYNDIKIDDVYVSIDNDWRHYEYEIEVENYSNIYNFIDFENIGWIYIYIKNIQVRKCGDIGYIIIGGRKINNNIFSLYCLCGLLRYPVSNFIPFREFACISTCYCDGKCCNPCFHLYSKTEFGIAVSNIILTFIYHN